MDFAIPQRVTKELEQFEVFLRTHLEPQFATWYKKEAIPRQLFQSMGPVSYTHLRAHET